MARQRPLPRDTNDLANAHWFASGNLGLLLDKYQPWMRLADHGGQWDTVMSVQEWRQHQWQDKRAAGGEAKGYWFSGPIGGARMQREEHWLEPNKHLDKGALQAFRDRWRATVAGGGGLIFDLWTAEPLVVGLGAESTLETALTLHRVYGFPIIPGSSLKGVARAMALYALAESVGVAAVDNEAYLNHYYRRKSTPLQLLEAWLEAPPGEQEALSRQLRRESEFVDPTVASRLSPQSAAAQQFRRVFGWRERAGDVVFFDAIPAEVPKITGDVMTPHFFDYYSGSGDPNDADAPQPVSFLTVNRGVLFQFAVGLRTPRAAAADRQQAEAWLAAGLQELGIGGKTGAGYGFFGEGRPRSGPQSSGAKEASFIRDYNRSKEEQAALPRVEPELRPETDELKNRADDIFAQLQERWDEDEDEEG